MAMNKKEQKTVECLKTKLALRFTEEILPDIPAPIYGEDNTVGFVFNKYNLDATPACSSCHGHSTNYNHKTTSQGSIELFSTKLLALKSMRYEVEFDCAKKLRRVDLIIEECI